MHAESTDPSMNRRELQFFNGNIATAIFPSIGIPSIDIITSLRLKWPGALIMLVGGGSAMDSKLFTILSPLFQDGIASVASSLGALVIDGGTQAGIMELMGLGIAGQKDKSSLLGVAPSGTTSYPGKIIDQAHDQIVALDPNHSHFVLVETDIWGGETETMYELARAFSQHCPSVAILVNGGMIAKREVLYNVRQKRPLIIIEGSGRLADEIVNAWHKKSNLPTDPDLAEIIAHGNLSAIPFTASITEFKLLVHTLLNQS